jgi:[ribosomal protein S5]-alanine N-acetyltransferase
MKEGREEKFAIIVDNQFAGWLDIHNISKGFDKHKAKVGYCISPEFRGKGLATEALKILTNYAFKKYNLTRIEAFCRTYNKSSAKVLEKAGYKLEGILRKNKLKNGKYLDDMVWAKIR